MAGGEYDWCVARIVYGMMIAVPMMLRSAVSTLHGMRTRTKTKIETKMSTAASSGACGGGIWATVAYGFSLSEAM